MELKRTAEERFPRIPPASAPVQRIPIAGGAGSRSALVERLRGRIRAIEQAPVSLTPVSSAYPPAPDTRSPRPACAPFPDGPPSLRLPAASGGGLLFPPGETGVPSQLAPSPRPREGDAWTFGVAEIDGALPGAGLGTFGLHEVRPETPRDQGAALGFALALIGRLTPRRPALLLWAATDALWRELGRPYGPGLIRFGIDPSRLLMIEARQSRDLAWALEEGIKSRALIAVLGQIETASPLVARRLALAARTYRCPCLLVPGPRAPGLAPVLTRWRVASAPSAPHPFDPAAPGQPRWRIALGRCRWGMGGQTWTVEWSDDAYRFRLAAPMADRAAEAGDTIERAALRA